jgi:sensor histidine kinase regulating citrate/malate metabolism
MSEEIKVVIVLLSFAMLLLFGVFVTTSYESYLKSEVAKACVSSGGSWNSDNANCDMVQ